MQSVEDASAPPTRSSMPSSSSGVRLRAGKGSYKGGGKARRNGDYVGADVLPEDDRPEPPPSHGTPSGRAIQVPMHLFQKGSGKGKQRSGGSSSGGSGRGGATTS